MFLLIMCRHLEVAHRCMTTAIKLVFPQALVAGAPSLVRQLMGDRMFNSRTFAQRGPSALGVDLGAQLLLELLVLADGQAPTVPHAGGGALRAHRTRITGTGRKLGVLAWDHGHGVAVGTGDRPMREVQGEVLLGEQAPTLWPGAGRSEEHTSELQSQS